MSANKYANLPDIDTQPDIYETEDVFPSAHTNKGDSSDDDSTLPTRAARSRAGENGAPNKEELDSSNLISADEASKRFRRAERNRRDHPRTHYAYPPSPSPPSPTAPTSLPHRLRALQAELTALEAELADPSNPLLHKVVEEEHVDAGAMLRGLVDVRGRLERLRKGKEGRGRLVGVVLGEGDAHSFAVQAGENDDEDGDEEKEKEQENNEGKGKREAPEIRSIVEMDRRVGELENLVGSSSAALDETSPLPPPLLPLLTRLNNQLTLLTQPRQVDSISRRLKLLLSDLDRVSSANQQLSHRRQPSQPPASTSASAATSAAPPPAGPPQSTASAEQLLPLLTRLGPALPHIPHILTRLRTLSALHTSAAEFERTLGGLEEEQLRVRDALRELESAVAAVDGSLVENKDVVKGNVAGLEERVEGLVKRLQEVEK